MSNVPAPNPNIPQIPKPLAALGSLANVAEALKQAVDSLAGFRGSALNRAVTFNDLVGLKVLTSAAAQSAASVTTVINPYVIAGFSGGTVLAAKQVLIGHSFSTPVVVPANFSLVGSLNSSVGSFVAAAASATLTFQRCPAAADPTVSGNWSTIGTAVFSPSGHAAALSTSGNTLYFAVGDFMRVVAPTSPDTSLAQVFLTIVGQR